MQNCYWISRDEEHCLTIWEYAPKIRDGKNFVDPNEVTAVIAEVDPSIWFLLSLSEEPKLGSCYKLVFIDQPHYVSGWDSFDVTKDLEKAN